MDSRSWLKHCLGKKTNGKGIRQFWKMIPALILICWKAKSGTKSNNRSNRKIQHTIDDYQRLKNTKNIINNISKIVLIFNVKRIVRTNQRIWDIIDLSDQCLTACYPGARWLREWLKTQAYQNTSQTSWDTSCLLVWAFGTDIMPKTRRTHADKVQFSAPDRRRFGANFKVAT